MSRAPIAFAAVFAWPSLALAADALSYGPLQIRWQAPSGCPDGDAIVERVRALEPSSTLGREIVSIDATVVGDEQSEFHVVLDATEGSSRFQRKLHAPSCEALADAAALTMALTIGQGSLPSPALADVPPPEPPAQPALDLPPAPPAASRVESVAGPSPSNAPSAGPMWGIRLAALGDAGTLPGVAGGLHPALGFSMGGVRVALGLLWMPGSTGTSASNPAKGGRINLTAGTARSCFTLFRGFAEIDGCAGVELGRIHGDGFGVDAAAEANRWWFAPQVAAFARFRTTERISLLLGAVALAPLTRTEFFLENVGSVHRASVLAGRIEAGLETNFP